ncbi:MAG: ester cyclase, partial [Planctomycetota bacterium]
MYSRIKNISIACIVLIALSGFFQTVTAGIEANKAIMLRAEEFWNTGNMAIADEVYSAEFVNHDPTAPDVGDLESYKGYVTAVRAGMPDFHVTTEAIVAEADKVTSRWTVTGTQTGELLGIQPTGIQARWTGITIYRYADGKIVEAWWSKDLQGALEQLGVIPPMREDYTWGAP